MVESFVVRESITDWGSDNHSAVSVVVQAASLLASARQNDAYGDDAISHAVTEQFIRSFGAGTIFAGVSTGTAANTLAVSLAANQGDAVFASSCSHIVEQEAGSLPAVVGAQLVSLEHSEGKLAPETVEEGLTSYERLAYHSPRPAMVTIANATEHGTVYQPDEVRRLAEVCHSHEVLLHMDGSRLANAAVATGLGLKECSRDLGVDLLSLGGAKNGLGAAEAVLVFGDPKVDLRRAMKCFGQLTAKGGLIAAQFLPYLAEDASWWRLAQHGPLGEHAQAERIDRIKAGLELIYGSGALEADYPLWRRNAYQANAVARHAAEGLRCALGDEARLRYPVETNQLFWRWPKDLRDGLRERGYRFLDWTGADDVRLVSSWDMELADAESLVEQAAAVAGVAGGAEAGGRSDPATP